ncbi:Sucrose nonfermenting 4-like protein [Sesbania bispinosa]|nr:Sucrose nonfermenting 4-like protein [Sesbania bispinosa]
MKCGAWRVYSQGNTLNSRLECSVRAWILQGKRVAVAGTVLIPCVLVWPYGGRSVFLSGSFTRLTPVTISLAEEKD